MIGLTRKVFGDVRGVTEAAVGFAIGSGVGLALAGIAWLIAGKP